MLLLKLKSIPISVPAGAFYVIHVFFYVVSISYHFVSFCFPSTFFKVSHQPFSCW